MRPSSWPRSCDIVSSSSSIESRSIGSYLPHPVNVILGTAGLSHAGEDGRDDQQDDEGSHFGVWKVILDFEDLCRFLTKG